MPVSKMGKSFRTSAASNVNVDITALHVDRKRLRRDDGRQARDLAGLEVEPRSVLRALDLTVFDHLPAAQKKVLVRANVVEGEESVLAVSEADLLAIGEDSFHRVDRN